MNINKSATLSSGNKFNIIQLFRFIAALMVIILHSSYYSAERLSQGSYIYNEGAHGVNLFFAISGFVMIISSERLIGVADGWKKFSIKRIIRIVPIYWAITTYKLLVMIFQSSLVYHARLDSVFILKSYFFIPAINIDGAFLPFYGVGWTLNFEMFFYLLFTVALALRVKPLPFLSLIFIPLAILSVFVTPHWPDVRFYANIIVLNFLYGMVAAKLVLSGKKLPEKLAISLVLIGLLYLFIPRVGPLTVIPVNNFIIGIASFIVVYGGASLERLDGTKIPTSLIYLGGASYSLYLIHPSVAPLIPALLNKIHLKLAKLATISVILSAIAAIGVGSVFYHFLEQPVTNFLTRWAKKIKLI